MDTRAILKKNHDLIVESMTSKQYFNWHGRYFKGDLDYKSMAWSIFHSTRSKKIRALCLVQIECYDSIFNTSGFETYNKGL